MTVHRRWIRATVNPEQVTVLIHIDPAAGDEPSFGDGSVTSDDARNPLAGLRWYCDYLSEHSARVCILLPNRLRDEGFTLGETQEAGSILWYGDDGAWKLPKDVSPEHIWLINGERLPIVDWNTAGASADRIDADILVFDPSTPCSDRHYSESVLVDSAGAVVQVRRHYDDSPSFTDLWSGQASFLMTNARLAVPVVSHVLLRGWGLESIGSLTRRFTVRWSEAPSALSGAGSRHVVTGPLRTTARRSLRDQGKASTKIVDRPANETVPRTSARQERGAKQDVRPDSKQGAKRAELQAPAAPRDAERSRTDDRDEFAPTGNRAAYLATKRAFDLLVSGVGLLALSPLLGIIAVLVKLTSRGPVFFAHSRQGLAGKSFACLKFRSMSADADALQAKLRAKNEVDGPQFKMAVDPRVTWLGGWLRRLNLDELPQLINVFLGQMSLVGPRPSPDAENQVCPPWRRARLSVKPGITGLWQVLRTRDRPDTDFQEWIYYDVEYARHRSLWLDAWTLMYTPVSMFAPKHLDRFVRKLERRGICLSSDRRVLETAMPSAEGRRPSTLPSPS